MICMYNSCLHDIINSAPPLSTCGHDKHYLRCCLPTYLRVSTAAALTISTHFCPATSCHHDQRRTRAGPSHHSTLPRWHGPAHNHLSRERGSCHGDQCGSAVSRVTCHDVVTLGSMWDSSLTSAAERKYLSTENLLGEDSCDIWSGSGAQNSVWDTR